MSDAQSILDRFGPETDSNGANTDVECLTLEEILASLMVEEPIEEPCVSGACVMCSNATVNSTPVHIVKDIGKVELNGLAELNKKDIIMDMPFAKCKTAEKNKCDVTTADIENEEWQGVDKTNYQGEDEESLISQSSYMVCTKEWGIIYFVDDGQQAKKTMDGLSTFLGYVQEQFGFDKRTASVIGRVYLAIQEKFAYMSQQKRDWFFARSLSQMGGYDEKELDAWVKGAGRAFQQGKEKDFFVEALGIDESDYKYMRYMVRLQNGITSNSENNYACSSVREMQEKRNKKFQEWKEKMVEGIGEPLTDEKYLEYYEQIYNAVSKKGDFAHMMYTLSANLISEGDGVENQWDGIIISATKMSWNSEEERKDITGWLGDAVYSGVFGGKVSFGMDDYIADLDADNIAHMVTDEKLLLDVTNEYYKALQDSGLKYREEMIVQNNTDDEIESLILDAENEYRAKVFVENNGYDKIEEAIYERISVIDVDGDKKITYKDLLEDKMYQETGEFLERLVVYSGEGKN